MAHTITIPPAPPRRPTSAQAAFVLATLGLTAVVCVTVLIYLPILAMLTGAMHPDAGLLLSVAAPLLLGLAALGVLLSITGGILATATRYGVAAGLAGAAIVLALVAGAGILATNLRGVLVDPWLL